MPFSKKKRSKRASNAGQQAISSRNELGRTKTRDSKPKSKRRITILELLKGNRFWEKIGTKNKRSLSSKRDRRRAKKKKKKGRRRGNQKR